MTKEEKYEDLQAAGADLDPIGLYTEEDINVLYKAEFGDSDSDAGMSEENHSSSPGSGNAQTRSKKPKDLSTADPQPRVLTFANSGWCEELEISYRKGGYRPRNAREFKALKKYAIKG